MYNDLTPEEFNYQFPLWVEQIMNMKPRDQTETIAGNIAREANLKFVFNGSKWLYFGTVM